MLANSVIHTRPRSCSYSFPSSKNCKLLLSPSVLSRFKPTSVRVLSRKISDAKRFRVRALKADNVSESVTEHSHAGPYPFSVKIPFGDRHILVETGHIGRQASAAVTVTDGETIVYTTVCLADTPSEPSDFFPLSVHYQERFSAAVEDFSSVKARQKIMRNCEIKSIVPFGAFVEIAPGREGLCHISELSPSYLSKAEDAFKVGDRVDVKLIEVNEKGQLRLSRRALIPDADPLVPTTKERPNTPKESSTLENNATKSNPRRSPSMTKDGSKDGNSDADKVPPGTFLKVSIP